MASKRKAADLLAVKQRKQKKIAIGGLILLIGVLAFQGPRTLKMLNPPATQPASEAAASDEENQPKQPPPPVSFQLGGDASNPAGDANGKLISFDHFESKDPFVQQVAATASEGSGSAGKPSSGKGKRAGAASGTRPEGKPGGKRAKAPAGRVREGGRDAGRPSSGGQAGAPETQAPQLSSALIAVNGGRETVTLGEAFPSADKVFRLVSLTPTSAKIGVVGGTFGGGVETVTLERGKTRTIMNSASGAQYVLRLVSTG